MTNEQQHLIYFTKSGKPTLSHPADLFDWVAERAALAVCMKLGRNTVDASDIDAQFDVHKYLWGHSPASAAQYIADQYWRYMIESRG